MRENRSRSGIEVQSGSGLSSFEALHETYQRAVSAAGGPRDCYYELGGYRIRLRLAGPALERPLTRALAHRIAPPGPAALTVCAWDSVSTGTCMPSPEGKWWACGQDGPVDGEGDGRLCSQLQAGIPALSVLDSGRDLALYCVRDADQVPFYDRAAPLRFIFTCWLNRQGCTLMHAGAVGRPDGGVLLVGKGGAGKSTTALACLHSELLHVGEDYVLLSENPEPFVHTLYDSAKLHPDQLWRLPHLRASISNGDRLGQEKALFYLHEGFGEKLSAGFPVRAILLPQVTGRRETRLVPATLTQCLSALVPSSFVHSPGLGREGVLAMARVAQRIPAYILELGTDLPQIPPLISTLI